MSAVATVWAWAQQGLEPPQKLTLLALAEDANHQAQCWPSKAVLAARTCMADTSVAHCLKELESKGLIRREQVEGASAKIFLVLDVAPAVIQPKPKREVAVWTPSPGDAADIERAIAMWNQMAAYTAQGNPKHRLPAVRKLNPANQKHLKARLQEFGLDGWAACCTAILMSAHCRGVNDRGWKADISYLLQPKGSNKTINGGWPADYEEKTNGGQRTGPSGRGDQRVDSLRSFDAAIRGRLAEGDGRQGGGAQGGGGAGAAGGGQGAHEAGRALGSADRTK